jgi:protein-S-isoprenylcysteine O-methyltransferase Ste14
MSEVKKYLKRDWTVIPFMGLTLLGFVAAILDFIFLQNFSFQIFAALGLILLIVKGLICMKARLQLKKKAGFNSLVGTSKLKTVKEHRLVKDGLYKHV